MPEIKFRWPEEPTDNEKRNRNGVTDDLFGLDGSAALGASVLGIAALSRLTNQAFMR